MAEQQAPGLGRTDPRRQDLSVPRAGGGAVARGHRPGSALAGHTHPGEEIISILQGPLEHQIEGQPPTTFHAGEALTVPAGTVHAVRIAGSGNAAELAAYAVDKGKPLLMLAE